MTDCRVPTRFSNSKSILQSAADSGKRALVWMLLTVVSLALTGSRVYAQYGASPQVIRLSSMPGRSITFHVSCRNGAADEVGVKGSVRYVGTSDDGMPVPSNEARSRSCVEWLRLDPDVFTIGPGESKEVQCKLDIPSEGVLGGYYAYIGFLFKPRTPSRADRGATILMQFRVNCIVLLTIGGDSLRTGLNVAGLDLWIDDLRDNTGTFDHQTRAWKTRVDLINTGNTHISSGVRTAIFEESGKLLDSAECEPHDGLVLPGVRRSFEGLGSVNLADGIYVCSIEAGSGTGSGAVRSVPFVVLHGKIMKGEPTPAIRAVLDATVPGFTLDSRAIEQDLPPKARRTKVVELKNLTAQEIQVQRIVLGITQRDDGSLDYEKLANDLEFMPSGGMIRVEPESLKIAPGRKGKFKVRLEMPKDAEGEYNGAIVFSRKGTTPVLSPVLLAPVSTQVHLTAKGTEKRAVKLTKFEASKNKDGTCELKVWLKNEGNCRVGIVGQIEVKDEKGNAVPPAIQLGGKGTMLYPGVEAYLTANWSAKPEAGKYKAAVVVNPEDEEVSAKAEFEFKVPQ